MSIADMGRPPMDTPPLKETREKVEKMQHYIEEYYWELFSYLYQRQKR